MEASDDRDLAAGCSVTDMDYAGSVDFVESLGSWGYEASGYDMANCSSKVEMPLWSFHLLHGRRIVRYHFLPDRIQNLPVNRFRLWRQCAKWN